MWQTFHEKKFLEAIFQLFELPGARKLLSTLYTKRFKKNQFKNLKER